MAQVKKQIKDIAVTIDVHPWALGIKPEGTGQITVPPSITIQARCVTNMHSYRNRDLEGAPRKGKYTQITEFRASEPAKTIPALIESLKVRPKKGSKVPCRTVVVVEHRNLKKALTSEEAGGDIILVTTSGMPGGAVKELLNMLCKAEEIQDLPFLYFGDHDYQGFQIFYNLKYGTKTSAWRDIMLIYAQWGLYFRIIFTTLNYLASWLPNRILSVISPDICRRSPC